MNWISFAAAVVAQMLIGYIWFHPAVMGKMHAKANGMEVKDMKPKNAAMAYGTMVLLTIFFTLFLHANVTGPGQDVSPSGHSFATFGHGVFHGILLTIMIIIPLFATPAMFERRGWGWFIVHAGHWSARAIVAFGILSAWR